MTLQQHIEKIEAEYDDLLISIPDNATDEDMYGTLKTFLLVNLCEIATASLEAVEVKKIGEAANMTFNRGYNAAVSEQKKRMDEYLKT